MEPAEDMESSSSATKELRKNKQLDSKTLHYLNTKIQLHAFKKFMYAEMANKP